MKLNPKALALMVALSAASASAAGTPSGTPITNTASATYNDPSAPSNSLTSTSNTVNTVVLPKPDFDVIFKSASPTDGGTQNAVGTTTKVLQGTAGSSFVTLYTVRNDGNVNNMVVQIAPNTTGVTGTQTVAYYRDVNGNGIYDAGTDTALTDSDNDGKVDVSVPDAVSSPTTNGLVDILQVITVASGADASKVYGASPEGTVSGTGTTVTNSSSGATVSGNGYTNGSTNYEQAKTQGTDLQFTRVELYSLAAAPYPSTTPTKPVTTGGGTYNPSAVSDQQVPTLAAGNTDTTLDTPPTQAAKGYVDGGSTPIIPDTAGNNQIAYPKADTDNNPDVVTFTNTVYNNGTASDTVQLFPTAAVNDDGTLKTGWTYDATTATFTYTDGTKVQFLDTSGAVIPKSSSSLFPAFTVAPGATAYFQTKVTYPDADDSTPIAAIVVPVGVDSLSDTDTKPNATTTDTIYPAAAQFGDSTAAQGAVNTPAPVQTVTPYGNFATDRRTSPDGTDSTAVFPMDVANTGTYNDSYKLTGTVTFTVNGTATPTTVRYYDASTGTELSKDSSGNYVTPVVAAGAEYKVLAVVDVPQGAATGNYTVTQNATGEYSTIPMTDTNDVITVAKPGSVAVAKFIAQSGAASETVNGLSGGTGYASAPVGSPTTAKPSDTISYKIMAKNNYPSSVANFQLSDTLNTNVTFASATVSGTDSSGTVLSGLKVLYKVGGTYTATAPSDLSTVTAVAADLNGDGALSAADVLAAGSTITLNINTTVK